MRHKKMTHNQRVKDSIKNPRQAHVLLQHLNTTIFPEIIRGSRVDTNGAHAMALNNRPGFEIAQAEIRSAGREADEAPILVGTTAVNRTSTLDLNVTKTQGMRHGDKKKRAKRRCVRHVRYHGTNPTECMGALRYGKVACQYYFDDGTQVET
jgi:hypothetical protein